MPFDRPCGGTSVTPGASALAVAVVDGGPLHLRVGFLFSSRRLLPVAGAIPSVLAAVSVEDCDR